LTESLSRFTRLAMLLVLIAVMLWAVAGCGEQAGEQPAEEPGEGEAAEEVAGENGIVIGYDQEPQILNSFIQGGDLAATSDMTAGILQAPLRITPDLSTLESAYQPELAESQPEVVSEDPLIIEYTLREGITWSDGEPLTSEDARWTYEQIMDEDNQIITRVGWELIESFETPDERTVRITFSEPYAPWRDLLATAILPKHIYENEDFNTALNNEIVGSGPFVLEEWRKGQDLTLVKNENYWGEEPALDRITFRFIPDTNTLITSLEAGEVDFINPPPDIGLIERLENIQGAQVETAAGTTWEHIAFNLEEVDNLQLRQAIAYGINRQQVVDEILQGEVPPLHSILVPEQGDFYTPAWEQYTHDPERARQLVEEAEAAGAETTITFSTTAGNALRETLQQVVQQQLQEVGIDIRIENTAAQTFFGQWTVEGNFQMGEWAWLASPDPSVTTLFSADQIPPDGQNYYRYENEQVTEWLNEADRTVDVEQRAELLRQVQEQMAEDLPLIPMFQRPVTYAFVEGLEGPEVNPTLAGPFWNIEEWSISR
jgi:peptide/nickel transport system substrate-binding protein